MGTQPFFTNDAIVLGILIIILAVIFKTASSNHKFWKKFYIYVPALLLCYFIPALFHWPLGLISPDWYDIEALRQFLIDNHGAGLGADADWKTIKSFVTSNGIEISTLDQFKHHTELYFMASRYLLPASLILLTLSIDLKEIANLGYKAIIMFFAGTVGIIIGGPIAILVINAVAPDIIPLGPTELWHGLSTIAGSWIGGGANQTAMKEIFEVSDNLFASMIVVDVIVANIWMGFLLYGANITKKLDKWLKADVSAIEQLKEKVKNYRSSVEKIPSSTDLFIMLAIAFGGVAISHWGSDIMSPFMGRFEERLVELKLNSLMSKFFWLIVFATTFGLILSFTKAKKLEGVGASRWGSIFIYILVATIGMKMNLGEIFQNLGLFAIGLVWMLVHVLILLVVSKLIKAPFFFVAVGSQANVGGAASAPIVASAFSPSLAPVGVLMAVLGYALGTYGAIITAFLMQSVSG
jgi:uncharacterized membrane protein